MALFRKNFRQLARISYLLVREKSYVVEFLVLNFEKVFLLPAVLGYDVGLVVHLELLNQV